jgi:hypothetical protein
MKPAVARKSPVDAYFWAQYRTHVGTCLTCACNFDGPDQGCDIGVALHNLATRGDWELRKAAFLGRGRSGSP